MMLWCILIFFNPYSDGISWKPALTTFVMLFLPASLAILGVLYSYRLPLVAFDGQYCQACIWRPHLGYLLGLELHPSAIYSLFFS